MSRFTDGLITFILMVCAVPAMLAVLALMAVWWVVAIVSFGAMWLAELIWPARRQR